MKNLFHKSTTVTPALTEELVVEELSEQDLEQVTGGYGHGWGHEDGQNREGGRYYWQRWYRYHHGHYGHGWDDRDDRRRWYR
ncbi:MAG TPA: hypothetical protein VHZ51_09230 [Ktedonobacteraceae bacterium]|nr:hypothetical protein [Ktedonobacteraceae bacterium]